MMEKEGKAQASTKKQNYYLILLFISQNTGPRDGGNQPFVLPFPPEFYLPSETKIDISLPLFCTTTT